MFSRKKIKELERKISQLEADLYWRSSMPSGTPFDRVYIADILRVLLEQHNLVVQKVRTSEHVELQKKA